MMMIESKISAKNLKLLAVIFFGITAIILFDMIADTNEKGFSWHVFTEAIIGILSAGGFAWLVVTLKTSEENLKIVTKNLTKLNEESQQWRKEAEILINGLSDSIDKQMGKWGLSKAEKEIALLLLKGLTIKEISSLRETSEKTVRAQTLSIYSKSGLSGRSELSAFFLEDLLSPNHFT